MIKRINSNSSLPLPPILFLSLLSLSLSTFLAYFFEFPALKFSVMASYSEAHICQCLSRLAAGRRDFAVTINGGRRKTGMQFVEGVMGLAHGLIELGIKPGDVVSISALNRFAFNALLIFMLQNGTNICRWLLIFLLGNKRLCDFQVYFSLSFA